MENPERTNFNDVLLENIDIPSGIYLFKFNYRNTRTRCNICSKLTIKNVIGVVLVSLLLALNIFHTLF